MSAPLPSSEIGKPYPPKRSSRPPIRADADRAGAGDNDGAVRTTMGTETGSQAVADEANGGKRMRNLFEAASAPRAPETGKTDPCVHQRKILAPQSCLLGCDRARAHDRLPRLVDAQPRRCRSRAALAERGTIFILDASAATATAAVNPEIQCVLSSPCCSNAENSVPVIGGRQQLCSPFWRTNPPASWILPGTLTDARLGSRADNCAMTSDEPLPAPAPLS